MRALLSFVDSKWRKQQSVSQKKGNTYSEEAPFPNGVSRRNKT